MLGKKLEAALNDQLQAELYSAYLYLSMAAYCEEQSLSGSAKWLEFQAQEEVEHAMKFYSFINERGGRVKLGAIEEPPSEFESLLDVFKGALEHEKKVTSLINDLYELSLEENDYATQVFLNWFIDEQVEEEASAEEIVEQLKMVAGKDHALLSLDKELGRRQEEGE